MRSHTRKVGGKHHLLGVSLALLAMLVMALTQPVGAQPDEPPLENDYVSCGHFENQAGAQQALDENPTDPMFTDALDGDGNGVACEDAFNDDGQPSVFVCNEAAGTVVEVLATAFHEGSLDFPYRQVTPAERESGVCAAAATEQEQEPPVDEGGIVFFCNDATGDLIEIPSGQVDQVVFEFPASRATDDEIAAGECEITAPEATPIDVCNEATGEIIEVPRGTFDDGALDFPARLPTDAEVEDGECEVTAPEATPLLVCNLRSGELVEVSQREFDEGTLDFPAVPAEQAEIDAGECSLADAPSCDDFASQAAAQTVIDANPTLAVFLDADGDGIACEPVKDTDGGEPGTDNDKDKEKDEEPMEVTALPSTGTGPSLAPVQQSPQAAILVVLAVGTMTLCSQLRREKG